MKRVNWICASLLLVGSGHMVMAQSAIVAHPQSNPDTAVS
jgi:hypothetical protein